MHLSRSGTLDPPSDSKRRTVYLGHQYAVLTLASFQSQVRYVGAGLGGFMTQYLFGVIRTGLLLAALTTAAATATGYSATTLVNYAWATQMVVATVGPFAPLPLQQQLKTGALSTDLLRPVNLQLLGLAETFGRSLSNFLTRGIPVYLVGVLTCGGSLPGLTPQTVLGFGSIALAIVLSYATRFVVVCCGFWTTETRGIVNTLATVGSFLGGFVVPVHLFPNALSTVSACLPYMYTIQVPIDALTGYSTSTQALHGVSLQLAWIIGLLTVGHLIFRLGINKLEVQGG